MNARIWTTKSFAPALALLLLAMAFTYGPGGVRWFWADQPVVAFVLVLASSAFWVLSVLSSRRN